MKQKNVILMAVAVGCGLVAAVLTAKMRAQPKIEEVEVVIATKDLPTGTKITKETVEKVTAVKAVPKAALPQQFVAAKDRADLVGKELARGIRAGEIFNPADFPKSSGPIIPDGKDMYAIKVDTTNGVGGAVRPGNRVDIVAGYKIGKKTGSVDLLVDMLVIGVNGEYDGTRTEKFATLQNVTLAVDGQQAKLIKLAERLGCTMSLTLINPNRKPNDEYDIEKVFALLRQAEESHGSTVDNPGEEGSKPQTETVKVLQAKAEIAPNTAINNDLLEKFEAKEVSKAEAGDLPCGDLGDYLNKDKILKFGLPAGGRLSKKMIADAPLVKVLRAKEDIAPNTVVTKELADKFEEKSITQAEANATGACGDLTEYMGKALKFGVPAGQAVTTRMFGEAPPADPVTRKPEPADTVIKNKPEPKKGEATQQAPEYRDVRVEGLKGVMIHRYQWSNGGWVLVAELTPGQAARSGRTQPAVATEKPETTETETEKPTPPVGGPKVD